MRAIILAAGRGMRLQRGGVHHPKCLLRFDSMTLIERHLRLLEAAGVEEIVLALGFRHELVEAELDRLRWLPRPAIVVNPHFELGSMLTVHSIAEALTRGGEVLLMDADVLYDGRIPAALVGGPRRCNQLLMDRNFEAGDEPVKICLRDGVPVELRKVLANDLQFDTIGESVGFFRFDEAGAGRLATIVAGYVDRDCGHMPHEEAVRDLILRDGKSFEVADITGSPWIEIDFPVDVTRAEREIMPLLEPLEQLEPSMSLAERLYRTTRG